MTNENYERLKTAIISLVTLVLGIIGTLCFSSCGTTRAVVRNSANNTTTTIKISTNNPTSVTASPDVELNSTPNVLKSN